jgi:SAM-dependent methyltransferase
MHTNHIKIDPAALSALAERPPLYTEGDPFWQDPYIAARLLEAHLDPSHDAASKTPETIDAEVRFISETLGLNVSHSIIDLGCGPGLYCERFRAHCGHVTGVDFSQGSIDHAVRSARTQGLDIAYTCMNYLELEARPEYDMACVINYDFGALRESDMHTLLTRIHRALKPGGVFVFDVHTPACRDDAPEVNWYASQGGFWHPGPYLVLEKRFAYPEEVRLTQYIVITGEGRAVYRIYDTHFTLDRVKTLLEQHGFAIEHAYADLRGTALTEDAQILGIFAKTIN